MSTQPQHAEQFGDAERQAFRERLEACSDVDLVSSLMTLHKVVEQGASGHQRELCERTTVVITTTLRRFAPEPFADALAVWSEHSEDGDDA